MQYDFRKNLREELNFRGITVRELSVLTGIPVPTLDCYLGTRATIPSVDAAAKIAKALDVSIDYLVTGKNGGSEKPSAKSSNEAREIIRWIKTLSPEQCKAFHKLIKSF